MKASKDERFNNINSKLWMWFLPTLFLFTALIAMGFRELGHYAWNIDWDMNTLFDTSLILSIPLSGLFSSIIIRLYLGKKNYESYRLYLNNGFQSI